MTDQEQYVYDLYTSVLGRAPDPQGFADNLAALQSGAVDASTLAADFANSAEAQSNNIPAAQEQAAAQQVFQAAPPSVASAPSSDSGQTDQTSSINRDYVTALYRAVLGRAPDAAGFQTNLNALNSGVVTPQQLAASFASSPEAKANNIPASQEQSMAAAIANSYGQTGSTAVNTAAGDWSGVTPTQLIKAGITNPAVLKAAADGTLNDNIFGAYKVDANQVANALNSGTTVPTDVASTVNSATTNSFTPNGKVIGTKMANAQGTQAVYYFSDGSTALVNKDGSVDHVTPPVSNYRQSQGSMAVADNPGYTMFNGQLVKVETPTLQYDPTAGKVVQSTSGIPTVYDPGPQGSQGPLGFVTNNLANLDKSVSSAVPGGWTTLGMIAASALSAGTMAPLAAELGGAILGGTAATTGAATLGSTLLGSATSALMAGISGGDVGKAALMGAIGGAVGANSVDIAKGLVGESTLNTIAEATKMTQAQVANLITNSVSTGVSAAASGKGDIATLIANNLASTAVGNYTGNVLNNLNSDILNKVAGSVSTIARVGTTAALNNKDPQQAITNSMGQIIGNLVSQNLIQPGVTAVKDAIKNDNTLTPAEKTDAQKNAQLVNDGFNQIVQQFAQSTGATITPDQINNFIATAGAKDLPQYYPTAQSVTVTGAPSTTTDVGAGGTLVPVTTPTLKSQVTDPTTGNVTNTYADGTVKQFDAEGNPLAAPVDSNQAQLDKLWQDYMTGLKGSGGTNPTYSLSTLAGTNYLNGPGTGTDGTGTGTGGSSSVTGGTGIKTTTTKTTTTPGSTTSSIIPALATTVPTTAAVSSDIKDLTPGLTKGSQFKFANEPTFTAQLTPAPQQITNQPDYATEIMSASTGGSTNTASTDIADLKPTTTTAGKKFTFSSNPTFASNVIAPIMATPSATSQSILAAATGGSVPGYAAGQTVQMPDEPSPYLRASVVKGHSFQPFGHFGSAQLPGYQPQRFAVGGQPEGMPDGHNPQFFSVGGLNSLENTYVKGDGDGTSDSVAAMLAKGEFVIPADVVSDLGNGSNDAGAEVLDEFLKTIREHKRAADAKNLPPDSKGALAYLLDAKRKVG